MILHALNEYYLRKSADPDSGVAARGFEHREFPFVLVVDREGRLVQIDDMREVEGKRTRARRLLVPKAVRRSVNVYANLLWDTVEYATGVATKNSSERVRAQHGAFRERIIEVFGAEPRDIAVRAVLKFVEDASEKDLARSPHWSELVAANPFVTFRLQGDAVSVSERPDVHRSIRATHDGGVEGLCLVSGERDTVAVLHPAIKGVRNAQSTGGSIVSFNLDAFRSYAKEQGANAPVGERAAFGYSTALNHLLRRDSTQRLQVGDATTVFWSEKATGGPMESAFAAWFDPRPDNPDASVEKIRALYEFKRGKPLTGDDEQRFYVLGLAPNAARIAVRFWHVATIRDLGECIFTHFDALRITRPPGAPEHPSLHRLLCATALNGDIKHVAPNVAGNWMRTILKGAPYPLTLLHAAIRRCRAEGDVGYLRAALIKGCLNRQSAMESEVLSVALDVTNMNVGYRLGRLFAALEKIQEEASPGLNATIRDRYFGAASTNPLVAFPLLNRLKNHHLAKLGNRGRAVSFERTIGEIMDGLDGRIPFPPNLSLPDQGRFAVGYYHQRQKFFEKTGGAE